MRERERELLKRLFALASLSIAQFLQEAAAPSLPPGSPLAPVTRYDLPTTLCTRLTLSRNRFIFAWMITAFRMFMDFSHHM